MAKRIRADQLLFQQGLAESREKAKRLIMAGQALLVTKGTPVLVDKPGQQLREDDLLELKEAERFVSRGGYKLLTAIEHFNLDFEGLTCLDAGASTGGFTDCLLQHGAQKVYAVDVGTAQLHEKLRNDPRVISMENTNLRTAPADLLPETVDAVVMDVSFISLTRILPACMHYLSPAGFLVVLIKPQFELGPEKNHKGVVRNEADRLQAVTLVREFAQQELGLTVTDVVPSSIKGPKGNQEYLALLQNSPKR
ncbi:23S rRNA (cytidine1920-2'-O)/16S rRNA (cytidine1409-2'-O)-methyltransferase [Paucidesulfovibrio gracilis DSM 16080]|uniref:23S rRNA (Cytidine1920-2'-O)/16S rRNA (Cytidine1409-2'-O)-methyltransferase n=1 Tax=Paucidesulfovibrio gracilis DSM 16080 TaxID=1121449 RepID=A0A1T4WK74_9BACT|nr:TlyA family RNA methyltransferase [Paucidesulfovibrio gracilis]SKA77733.1 23S rRNA (cytidine1920-2'-O)/16S rRNA (cytidine1409-2'-O)-methyltransferase [Paucidesulfovibrio gracilis DSM 16080]